MSTDVLLIMGSKSDKEKANKVLGVWKDLDLNARVAITSCHKHGGGEFKKFIDGIDERIVVFLGGMSLVAPGLIQMLMQKADKNKVIFAIPTDKAALSAIQDLPKGTPVMTCGLNQVSLEHSLINSALAIANLYCILNNSNRVKSKISLRHQKIVWDNPLTPNIELNSDGLLK